MPATPFRQKGVTVVELMIGLLLGVFLLGGMIYVYLGNSQTYRTNEAVARLQENGRFAMDFIAHDLRLAGHKGGCGRSAELSSLLNENGTGYDALLFEIGSEADSDDDMDFGVRGWEGGNGGYALSAYRTGTDSVLVKHGAVMAGANVNGSTAQDATSISLTGASGIAQGQMVIVSDGEGCNIFQNQADSAAAMLSLAAGAGKDPGNRTDGSASFSKNYDDNAEITLFHSAIYYIGTGAGGVSALRRVRYDRGEEVLTEELVEGVLDMALCYGEDEDQNGDVTRYVSASNVSDWRDVFAVRVNLVLISPESNVATEAPAVHFADCDGTVLTRTHTHYPELAAQPLAQVFSFTVGLRNRLQ